MESEKINERGERDKHKKQQEERKEGDGDRRAGYQLNSVMERELDFIS